MRKFFTLLVIITIISSSYYIYKNETTLFKSKNISASVAQSYDPLSTTDTANQSSGITRPTSSFNKTAKKVSITTMTIGQSQDLEIKKTGIAKSDKEILVQAETSGKIVKLNVKVGDTIKKGSKIATIGDSTNSDILDIQYNAAIQSLNSAERSKALTQKSINESTKNLKNGIEAAEIQYEQALENKDSALDILELQKETTEDQIDELKDTYKDLKNDYYKILDTTDDKEAELREAVSQPIPNEVLIGQLKKEITELEVKRVTIKDTKSSLKTKIETAENGLDQLDENIKMQENNLSHAVEMAEINIANSKNQLASTKAQLNISLEQINSSIIQANAQIQQLQVQRKSKSIKSSVTGTVTKVMVSEGNLINMGQPIIQISDTKNNKIFTTISVDDAKYINEKTSVKISTQNKNYNAKIKSISPSLNPQTKMFDVEITSPANIPANSTVEIFFTPMQKSKLLIPLNSITPENDSYYLFTVKNGKAVKTEIKIGDILNELVEVKSGLKTGDIIVTSQHRVLEDGTGVMID